MGKTGYMIVNNVKIFLNRRVSYKKFNHLCTINNLYSHEKKTFLSVTKDVLCGAKCFKNQSPFQDIFFVKFLVWHILFYVTINFTRTGPTPLPQLVALHADRCFFLPLSSHNTHDQSCSNYFDYRQPT